MHEDLWVWVVDDVGRGYPSTHEAVALDPGRFTTVPDHPVRDADGRLLPTEFPDAAAPAPFDLTPEAEEAY